MAKTLPDIIYDKSRATPIIDSNNSFYHIPFYKDEEYFADMDNYTNFVKGVEKAVRSDDRYNKYIFYLKKEVRLNHCQVLKNIDDDDFGNKPGIEMHHGPIFNLFDYCSIILEYFLLKKWKITTFRVADVVLDEHQRNRVQVVMLTTSMHQLVHDRGIFINYKQAYGNLNEFIEKYRPALTVDAKEKLNRYIDRSLLMDSNDFGVLELNKKLYEK